jgi:hypothetical protein
VSEDDVRRRLEASREGDVRFRDGGQGRVLRRAVGALFHGSVVTDSYGI